MTGTTGTQPLLKIQWGGEGQIYQFVAIPTSLKNTYVGFIAYPMFSVGGAHNVIAGENVPLPRELNDYDCILTLLFSRFLELHPVNKATHADALALAWSWAGCEIVEEQKRFDMLTAAIARYQEGK